MIPGYGYCFAPRAINAEYRDDYIQNYIKENGMKKISPYDMNIEDLFFYTLRHPDTKTTKKIFKYFEKNNININPNLYELKKELQELQETDDLEK